MHKIEENLRKLSFSNIKFTKHAEDRIKDRNLNKLLLVSLLQQPKKLLAAKKRAEKYELEFFHTPKLSIKIIGIFVQENLKIITAFKCKRK